MASPDTETNHNDGDDGGSMPPYESAPFTDWREQLRDRVKEIRARKLADKRRGGEDSLADRLKDADEIQADGAVDDEFEETLEQEEEAEVESVQSPDETEIQAGARPPTEVDSEPEETFEADVPEFAPYDPTEDEPVGEMALTPEQGDEGQETMELDESDAAPDSWRSPEHADQEEPEHERDSAPPIDLDAIPEDLKDKNIPAWAVPRRRQQETAEPTANEPAQETHAPAETDPTGQEPFDDLAQAANAEGDGDEDESGRLPLDGDPIEASEPETPEAGEEETETAPEPETVAPPEPADDVFLVSEFTSRDKDGETPRREIRDIEDVDPLDALRDAKGRKETDDAPEEPDERPIPNLYDEEDDADVEEGPTPFRGLLDDDGQPERPTTSASPTDDEAPDDEADETAEAVGTGEPRPVGPVWDDLAGEDDADEEADFGPPPDQLDPSAPVSDRIFSSLADGLVVGLIGLLLGFAGATAADTSLTAFVGAAPLPFVLACLIFALCYGVFFVGTCGQTLGKMVMRVRVIGAQRFEVGYATAARRALLYLVSVIPAGLGLLPAIRDPEHRALHDRFSGTRVVKA